MCLWDSINDGSAAGDVTVISACVHGCTCIGHAMGKGKWLRFPKPYEIVSFWTSASRSDNNLGSEVSIATGQERIGLISRPVGKITLIHRSMYDVPGSRSSVRFSTIPNHVCPFRSPIHTCGNMRPCTGTAFLLAVHSGETLIGLTFKC